MDVGVLDGRLGGSLTFVEEVREPEALAEQLDGLVHLDTQRAPTGIDLTVDSVFRTTGHGQLDFGGDEFTEAPREALTPVLDDPDDDYAWWTLQEGAYIVQYNESLALPEGTVARVQTRDALLARFGMQTGAAVWNSSKIVPRAARLSRKGVRSSSWPLIERQSPRC